MAKTWSEGQEAQVREAARVVCAATGGAEVTWASEMQNAFATLDAERAAHAEEMAKARDELVSAHAEVTRHLRQSYEAELAKLREVVSFLGPHLCEVCREPATCGIQFHFCDMHKTLDSAGTIAEQGAELAKLRAEHEEERRRSGADESDLGPWAAGAIGVKRDDSLVWRDDAVYGLQFYAESPEQAVKASRILNGLAVTLAKLRVEVERMTARANECAQAFAVYDSAYGDAKVLAANEVRRAIAALATPPIAEAPGINTVDFRGIQEPIAEAGGEKRTSAAPSRCVYHEVECCKTCGKCPQSNACECKPAPPQHKPDDEHPDNAIVDRLVRENTPIATTKRPLHKPGCASECKAPFFGLHCAIGHGSHACDCGAEKKERE